MRYMILALILGVNSLMAWTFYDGFEDYTPGSELNGQNGWVVYSQQHNEHAIVNSNVIYTGTQALNCYADAPGNGYFYLEREIPVQKPKDSTTLWIDFYVFVDSHYTYPQKFKDIQIMLNPDDDNVDLLHTSKGNACLLYTSPSPRDQA